MKMADAPDVEMVPAGSRPCALCPWRLANQGKKHPHGFYLKANLKRLWGGLKNGERMTCHPTDPRMAEFEGYERQEGRKVTRECAGALILIQREMAAFSHCAKAEEQEGGRPGGAMKRYRAMRPKGMAMSREGLASHVWDFAVRTPFNLAARKMNLVDPEVGYEALGKFDTEAVRLGLEETKA